MKETPEIEKTKYEFFIFLYVYSIVCHKHSRHFMKIRTNKMIKKGEKNLYNIVTTAIILEHELGFNFTHWIYVEVVV